MVILLATSQSDEQTHIQVCASICVFYIYSNIVFYLWSYTSENIGLLVY